MDLGLAHDAVDWYFKTIHQAGIPHAEVHFFGGEPFCAPDVLDLVIPLARRGAAELGCSLRFEVATNGVFDRDRCHWAADNIDTIVLSLDGPAEIHNRHRPYHSGRGSFEDVAQSAEVLSAGNSALYLRACVTGETVNRLPEIAGYFCERFGPDGVCFEPLQPSTASRTAGLEPPGAWDFVHAYAQASRLLASHGVEAVLAAADVHTHRVSFCPVGQDVAIVSPDGRINACYLMPEEWEAHGLDLCLGRWEGSTALLDPDAVAAARALGVHNKPFCARCFCRWHCAGGCHVNHRPEGPPGTYDRLCIQTRAIALQNVLEAMGQDDLAARWLGSQQAMETAICQPSDLLADLEMVA
jgi:uncharacterized protein